MKSVRRPHVLFLARSYPNVALPTQGIWAERMVRAATATARVTVVAPVPYVPRFVRHPVFARYHAVPRIEQGKYGDVHHPRMLTGPGMLFHAYDGTLMRLAISRLVRRLHRLDSFDMIHTQFIYPEGVAAARLGRALGIPVMTTEQAHWVPWLVNQAAVRRQVLEALPDIRLVTGMTPAVCDGIRTVSGGLARVAELPNVLEDEVFPAPAANEPVNMNQLLFVGIVRHVKGLDVLVRAMALLAERHPDLKLRVIGEPYQRAYQRDEQAVRDLVGTLRLADRIQFTGHAAPAEVATAMRRAALVVVPSRRESFSAVTLEALASGTPVVASRCGGPEFIIGEAMGSLVPPDDPAALAAAIEEMLVKRPTIDRSLLHRHAVERFGLAASSRRIGELYDEVLGQPAAKAVA